MTATGIKLNIGCGIYDLGIYRESYRRIYHFTKLHPVLPEVVVDMMRSGMSPEDITLDFVEKQIGRSRYYQMKDLSELLRPTRKISHWELSDEE